MKNTLKLSLKANEKIYVNGAVLRFDRRTSVEFLNDVNFLWRPMSCSRKTQSLRCRNFTTSSRSCSYPQIKFQFAKLSTASMWLRIEL